LRGVGLLWWLFGLASFGGTGGNILTVLIANLGFIFGPFVFFFGDYLLLKVQVLRWFKKR
ncbi:MAG: hypothetical protein KY445_16820, partial [Armatimonadetes bacterium]|nr:hypothetical protein [Armatimonadota bacterium]